ncbi:unnamed protein product [Prunus armeniaca]|uniref:Uncharacterized protein n=1 Tax=Prunus armeniaca TaxID=36596 RepID=A0A6J5VK92_PRUAR|nr:unnamed protein product [Prunus armeniaca]CAB4319924.1 unnamed protein product [Prunus armeniaca]
MVNHVTSVSTRSGISGKAFCACAFKEETSWIFDTEATDHMTLSYGNSRNPLTLPRKLDTEEVTSLEIRREKKKYNKDEEWKQNKIHHIESRKGCVQRENKEHLKGIKGLREDAAQQQRIGGETNVGHREKKTRAWASLNFKAP